MKKRLAIRLIEWRFRADEAEAIVGDLSEEFDERAAKDGAGSAHRWLWRQAIVSLFARRRTAASVGSRTGADHWWGDAKISVRGLRRSPGFAVTAILTLALGIGSATAIGTAASRTLLRPLPFPAGARLVALGHNSNGAPSNVGFLTVADWRARVASLEQVAIIRSWQPTLVEESGATRLNGMRVNWNFFRMLGVQPALGRDFNADEDAPDHQRVVVLSDGLWRRKFGASPSIVGTTVTFNSALYRVAGVMPASFEPLISERFYERAELWAPLGYAADGDSSCRSCRHLKAVGLLKPGVTLAQARAELVSVQAAMRLEHLSDYRDEAPVMTSLRTEINRPVRDAVEVLLVAVAFVLLVACANVAGLLMARAADRTQEMALRSALGASRGRIVSQWLAESAVLATVAGVLAVALARAGLSLLADRAPLTIPRIDGAAADPWLFGVALAVSLAALAGCAVIPAILSSRVGLEATLRSVRHSATRRAIRTREWLMSLQVAAALLVITGGGLMYRTVDHLLGVDPGFNPKGVLTGALSLVGPQWAEDADVRRFQSDLVQKIAAMPGVKDIALAGQIPLGGNMDQWGFRVNGRTYASEADEPSAERYSVTPDYFRLMGIPLKQGRLLSAADTFEARKVILVNETAARDIFPGESPIGKTVRFGSEARPRIYTIVGVVGDVRHYDLAVPAAPQFYSTQEQITDSYLVLTVRADHPEHLAAPIRQTIASLAKDVPFYDVKMFESRVAASVAARSFVMLLLALLGGITLVLAGVGLYGVVSQSIGSRQRELGIRVALGASRSSVLSLVARRGGLVCAGGIALGLAATAAGGQLIKTLLFETAPFDPGAIAGAVFLLLVVACAAHVLPIRRALRTDPRETLRAD